MDAQTIGGLVGIPGLLITLMTLREKRLTKQLEIEQLGQKMLFDRLQQLELREAVREKRVDELVLQQAELRHKHDKLQWEYEELIKDYKDLESQFSAEQKRASEAKEHADMLVGLLTKQYAEYEERIGKDALIRRKRP